MKLHFDRYDRVARFRPAMLMVAPAAWTAFALAPGGLSQGAIRVALTIATLFGGATLCMNIVRSRGKLVENRLLAKWGAWPTTIILRHADSTIVPDTKIRYHRALEACCPGIRLPTQDEERADPLDADNRYRSATLCLIERRRDPRYGLLNDELAYYGFRRNLLGIKPIALLITGLSFALSAVIVAAGFDAVEFTSRYIVADAASRWQVYAVAMADVLYAATLTFLVGDTFVRQSADEYAYALLRTLEV